MNKMEHTIIGGVQILVLPSQLMYAVMFFERLGWSIRRNPAASLGQIYMHHSVGNTFIQLVEQCNSTEVTLSADAIIFVAEDPSHAAETLKIWSAKRKLELTVRDDPVGNVIITLPSVFKDVIKIGPVAQLYVDLERLHKGTKCILVSVEDVVQGYTSEDLDMETTLNVPTGIRVRYLGAKSGDRYRFVFLPEGTSINGCTYVDLPFETACRVVREI